MIASLLNIGHNLMASVRTSPILKGVIFLLMAVETASAAIDLEENLSPFILETKRLTIPFYPDAFNPSILRWKGALLVSFRARDPLTFSTNPIGFVWLDDDFNVSGEPMMLQVYDQTGGNAMQDPRLIVIKEELYMVYSNTYVAAHGDEQRRVFISHVHYDGTSFSITSPQPILHFEGELRKFEKNWAPFLYKDKLLLSYSLSPHKVFQNALGTRHCQTFSLSPEELDWQWGQVFGGTPAYILDGQYLAFFHSSCGMSTIQSNGKEMPHYFMGAYTFQLDPPFTITQMSPTPIIGAKFYNGPAYKTWKPLRVIYPGGYVFDDRYIWISYGRQDHEVWITKLDKAGLLESLQPTQLSNSTNVKN